MAHDWFKISEAERLEIAEVNRLNKLIETFNVVVSACAKFNEAHGFGAGVAAALSERASGVKGSAALALAEECDLATRALEEAKEKMETLGLALVTEQNGSFFEPKEEEQAVTNCVLVVADLAKFLEFLHQVKLPTRALNVPSIYYDFKTCLQSLIEKQLDRVKKKYLGNLEEVGSAMVIIENGEQLLVPLQNAGLRSSTFERLSQYFANYKNKTLTEFLMLVKANCLSETPNDDEVRRYRCVAEPDRRYFFSVDDLKDFEKFWDEKEQIILRIAKNQRALRLVRSALETLITAIDIVLKREEETGFYSLYSTVEPQSFVPYKQVLDKRREIYVELQKKFASPQSAN